MPDRRLETAQAYLAAQAKAYREALERPRKAVSVVRVPFVTISRQSGAGGPPVARELARILSERHVGRRDTPWAVFDRELLQKIVEEHHFPEELIPDLEEQRATLIESVADDLFGTRPSAYSLVSMTTRMIVHLARLGNAIIVGRGGSVVTRHLGGGLHVRLVGSFWRRLRHQREHRGLEAREAEALIDREDEGRRKYLKRYLQKDIDDSLLYDLVLNTDDLGHRGAAELIAEGLRIKVGGES